LCLSRHPPAANRATTIAGTIDTRWVNIRLLRLTATFWFHTTWSVQHSALAMLDFSLSEEPVFMIALSRYRTFIACAALLVLSAGWQAGARPDLSAQSTDGALDKAVLDAFKWRSIGPDRGGRSIAVSGVKG